MTETKHCPTCICGRRAPVQGTRAAKVDGKPRGPGTVAWTEFVAAMAGYAARYGSDQGPERMAERGGLSFCEIEEHLGHTPTTWEPCR